ncbi:MAG: hypothetical protein ACKVS9_07980 [Phycisphaerae bacterium]
MRRNALVSFFGRRNVVLWPAIVVSIAALGGCPQQSSFVTVELVNDTSRSVRPGLFASGNATTAEALFVDANLREDFTDALFAELEPRETRTLDLGCEAEARLIGSFEASAFDDTSLLRIESTDAPIATRNVEFGCGDTVRIVYTVENGALRVRID